MLIFLSGVRRAILLPGAGHDHITLRELWQRITSQLGPENGQLKCAFAAILYDAPSTHRLTVASP